MPTARTFLKIINLRVSVNEKEILGPLNLILNEGETHILMGPNGSGKSTLVQTLAGSPLYKIESGKILFRGKEIAGLTAEKRARQGLFLAFQQPPAVPGLIIFNFLRAITQVFHPNPDFSGFKKKLGKEMALLGIEPEFLERSLNDGASGGEKKKLEILQMALLMPKLALLDEVDSGLDIDALKIVSQNIKAIKKENPQMSILLITHQGKILEFIQPDFVHVMKEGKIAKSGGAGLIKLIEKTGYSGIN